MIPHQQDDKFISHGVKSNNRFKLLNNSAIMDILSNRIYSDKFAAVLREIGCNAYDAHVAAGKKDVPFSVTLPTYDDPRLIIRDFGHGLPKDEVIELYTTYGFSSKTDSNDYVGFMGIGSKSPFCYTSTFEVNSYFDGKKNSFLMFKDDENIPNITHFQCIDCDLPTGLEIVIPVSKNDIPNFELKAKQIYQWFDVLPIVKKDGRDITLVKNINQLTEFHGLYIDPVNKILTNPVIKMGNIVYSLKREQIPVLTNRSGVFNSVNFLINFEIGEVEVDSGREGLQYTKSVIQTVDNKIKSIISFVEKDFNSQIDVIQKHLHKKKFANNYFNVFMISNLSWYDKPRFIANTFKFDSSLLSKEIIFSNAKFAELPEREKIQKKGTKILLSEDRYPQNTMFSIGTAYKKRQQVYSLQKVTQFNVLENRKIFFYKEGIRKEILNHHLMINHSKEIGALILPSRLRTHLEDEYDIKDNIFDLKIDDVKTLTKIKGSTKLTFPVKLVSKQGIVTAKEDFSPEEDVLYIVLPFKYGKLEDCTTFKIRGMDFTEIDFTKDVVNYSKSLQFDLIQKTIAKYNKKLIDGKKDYSFIFVNSKNKKIIKDSASSHFMMIEDFLNIISLDDSNIGLYPDLKEVQFKQLCAYFVLNGRNIDQYEKSFNFSKKLIPLFFKNGDKIYDFVSDNEIQEYFDKISQVSAILQLNSFFSRFFEIKTLNAPPIDNKNLHKVLKFVNVSSQIDTIKYYVEALTKANLT